jgi:nickel-dependent lactate racemase
MDFSIKYDTTKLQFHLDKKIFLGEIVPKSCQACSAEIDEVQRALEQPVGTNRLRDIVHAGEHIVIVTSDITRPMPTWVVLPPVLAELHQAGITDADITVVFALGSHRHHTPEEQKHLFGDKLWGTIRCLDSDADDCLCLGHCHNGTPVDIFREVAQADRRILLGNTEYHYFAGYSGGMKAIMPGVSSRQAIQANHSNMVRSEAYAGNLETNPVRNDIDEVGQFIPVDFIVNVVLDEHKKIARAFAGHYIQAHRASCAFLDSMYKIPVSRQADIVITSPGGYPKDINLYQAQKAIDNAKYVVRDGGIMIVAASCKEGYGSEVFQKWIEQYDLPEQRIAAIQEHFELGGHKAAAIAMVQAHATIYLVTSLDESIVIQAGMVPFHNIQDAIDAALAAMGQSATVYFMPLGGSTLPIITHK